MSAWPDERVPLLVDETEGLRLEFFDWTCGHTCPEPITGLQLEQVGPILRAISLAISQPGSARARVSDATECTEAYITDDYVRFGHTEQDDLAGIVGWDERPVIVHSVPDAELLGKLINGIAEYWGGPDAAAVWDGVSKIEVFDWVVTSLTPAELQPLTRAGRDAPPRLLDAAEVLREIDTYAAFAAAAEDINTATGSGA
jgi:hypothetical protein